MSSPVLTNPQGQAYSKPRPDVYTVLLALAILALIGAIVLLYLEMQRFEFDLKAPAPATGSRSVRSAEQGLAFPKMPAPFLPG